jgi:hypothetical protein
VSGLGNIEVPRGRQAVQAWRRLDRHTRREVTRYARRGLGHPDPQVAAIAVGRAQATLGAPLRRLALFVVASLLVNWPLAWALGRLLGGLDDQWLWFWVPVSLTLGTLVALRVLARQLERVNLATLDRQ